MTREELYQKVWSQPLRALAESMDISEVALAKRCRAAHIPVPPRGWWERKAAGKSVKIEPLPPIRRTFADYFPARDTGGRIDGADTQSLDPPAFRDMASVKEELRAMIKATKVPTTLERPHPAVARLLRMDAERKPSPAPRPLFGDRKGPKFATPIQQRRLCLLSTLLAELDRLGCKVSGNTHAGERFTLQIGGYWVHIFLGVEGDLTAGAFNGRPPFRGAEPTRLRFDITDRDGRSPPKRSWREDKVPLEQQVSQILEGVLLHAEEEARRLTVLQVEFRREEAALEFELAKCAAGQTQARKIATDQAEASARIDGLLSDADALERAARIRRYVAAVRSAAAEDAAAPPQADVEHWAAWALAQADAMDPVISGQFIADLKL